MFPFEKISENGCGILMHLKVYVCSPMPFAKCNSPGCLVGVTLLHSEEPKLYTILAFLSAIGLIWYIYCLFQANFLQKLSDAVIGNKYIYVEVI